MEQELNKESGVQKSDEAQPAKDRISDLKQKVNVDQQAIDEAREAVGDDEEKIKDYLINNRGL